VNPWGQIAGRFALWWIDHRPFSKEKRARRKAKRQVKRKRRKGETLTAEEESILSKQEDSSMLQGKKTYLGIAAVAIGLILSWLGIGECSPADLAAAVCESADAITAKIVSSLDQVLQVGGLLLAAYGRAKAKPDV
jgi:hypothetical protein